MSPELIGFLFVLGAGLSTSIGAAAVFSPRLIKLASRRFLAGSLGFAGGVMIYVSLVEIFQKSVEGFANAGYDDGAAATFGTTAFFGGVVFMFLCDQAVHWIEERAHRRRTGGEGGDDGMERGMDASVGGEQGGEEEIARVLSVTHMDGEGNRVDEWVRKAEGEIRMREEGGRQTSCVGVRRRRGGGGEGDEGAEGEQRDVKEEAMTGEIAGGDDVPETPPVYEIKQQECLASPPHNTTSDRALVRMGLATALSIAIHNFPEGLATFVATVDDTSVGATLAIAIAIHNIPEGLCVSIPIYYATGNRRKAFMWGCLSGVTEPIGAALGWAILADNMNDVVYGSMFGIVSGMMVMIVVKELLPVAHRYDPKDSVVTYSFVGGMLVMAASLVLFVAI
ncbi:hypothetical protein TrCOL_g9562 [Triparma columacea]|uniref:Zinc transporter n=1 Tax=Triparma columacea TaxID=722753 RepID=A0A9W7GLQ9_9STRA|nr:hypothetical protein TrCOL_g9562 [Triparma columacea]